MTDEQLIEAALEKAAGLSNYAAAHEIGVSEGTVRGWQKGLRTLRAASREAVRNYLKGTSGKADDELAQWFADFQQMVRNVGGRDDSLPAEERRARQRDLVNGMILARKQRGAEVPGELYALLGRLESGDL